MQLVDFDAAQAKEDNMLSLGVVDRLMNNEPLLLELVGVHVKDEFDNIYLDMYQANLNDEGLREAVTEEEHCNAEELKSRLDGRCTELKKEHLISLAKKERSAFA